MEKKQLNLNAPFYSVRRFSPSSHSCELTKSKSIKDKPLLPPLRQQSLPLHNKSEHENDVMLTTKPASVPFQWEQTPGRPKFESPRPNSSIRFFSGEIPKPPPGRLLSSGPSRFTSGEIPKPPLGRLLSSGFTSGDRSNDHHQHLLYKPQVEGFAFIDHASLLEKLNESLKCKDDESNNGDDGEVYSDALDDALSLSSGSRGSRLKPSGTFSVDERTRELMMDRFLPAAKAAVLETQAQYNAKRQPKTVDKKMVSGVVKKPIAVVKKQGFEGTLPCYDMTRNYVYNQESEDDEYNKESLRIPVKKSGKRWGIIPHFCVKNALCMLNPLPSLKPKSRPQIPSFGEVKKLSRNALSGPLDKIAHPVPQKKKSHSGLLSRELPRIEGKRLSNSGQFPNPRRDSYSLSTSPLRRYRSGNLSPCRNEILKSPSRQGSGFSVVPNKVDNRNTTINNNNNKFDDSKLASSRKLFKALQDVSRNQKNEKGSLGNDRNREADNKCLDNDEDAAEVKRVIREERKVETYGSTESEFACKSPLPPPLPKSPSESWLWRTLPLGNPFSSVNRKSPSRCNKNGEMDSNVESKWETIVKSSNLQRDRFRYSQELTPRLSHRQKLVKETL